MEHRVGKRYVQSVLMRYVVLLQHIDEHLNIERKEYDLGHLGKTFRRSKDLNEP